MGGLERGILLSVFWSSEFFSRKFLSANFWGKKIEKLFYQKNSKTILTVNMTENFICELKENEIATHSLRINFFVRAQRVNKSHFDQQWDNKEKD